mmetsp:Transcript_6030/g.8530  ORF Transcript_6030/g.8530 Transcript_6030/m.8530 type:complete len:308 (+) Transcript_6030:50-973(+)
MTRRTFLVSCWIKLSCSLIFENQRFLMTSVSGTKKCNEKMHDMCEFGAEALIILNSDSFGVNLLSALWSGAKIRVCADGGANKLYDLTDGLLVPDFIVGDLDSARIQVLDFYKQHGTKVERVEDQDLNDFDKAMNTVTQALTEPTVAVLGVFGGRLDQQMAAFDVALRWQSQTEQIFLFSDENAAILLSPNVQHKIIFRTHLQGPSCGLIPIAGKSDYVTTTGLQWNLMEQSLEFGKLVSSSNRVVSNSDDDQTLVTVFSSNFLLWTTELRSDALPAYILPTTKMNQTLFNSTTDRATQKLEVLPSL